MNNKKAMFGSWSSVCRTGGKGYRQRQYCAGPRFWGPIVLLAVVAANSTFAQPFAGDLDMNFAPRIASPVEELGAVVVQPDGKLLVSGLFGIVDSTHTAQGGSQGVSERVRS